MVPRTEDGEAERRVGSYKATGAGVVSPRSRGVLALALLLAGFVGQPVGVGAQDLDCADFATQAEAKSSLAADASQVESLDSDGDGEVCEALPPGEESLAADAADEDPLAARLGGTREGFEAEYGAPDEDADVPRFDVEDYGSVLALFEGDRTVSVTAFADRPADKPGTEPDEADWTVEEAREHAERFLPADAEVDAEPAEDRAGALTAEARSEALADAVPEDAYEELGVGGEPGDVRITLFRTEDGRVSSVNVGIGTEEDGEDKPAEDEEASGDRCEDVAPEVVAAIEAGLTVDGGGSLRHARAVRSEDYEEIWFVAADLEGAGMDGDGDVGVWATNDVDGVGTILAVDAVAQEFSDWPDGGGTDADLTTDDDGAEEARECVGEAA